MVSKSKILGQSSLIFVTVGSTSFNFNRLFKNIEKALLKLKLAAQLVVQCGATGYRWKYKNVIIMKHMSPKKMSLYYSKADRIIIHGGFGSLFLLSRKAKVMPLVIARLKKYKEHVNNHQKDFLSFLKKKIPQKFKKYFIDNEFVYNDILGYFKNAPEKNYIDILFFSKNNKNLFIKHLRQYINLFF